MTIGSVVPPLTIREVISRAEQDREQFALNGLHRIDLELFVEHRIPALFGVNYHYVEKHELPDELGRFEVVDNILKLRTEVRRGLSVDDRHSRFTVLHEFAHIRLHSATTLARATLRKSDDKRFSNSEWQADMYAIAICVSDEILRRFPNGTVLAGYLKLPETRCTAFFDELFEAGIWRRANKNAIERQLDGAEQRDFFD